MVLSVRILLIAGILLALAAEAQAQGLNPYSGGAPAGAKPTTSNGFSSGQELSPQSGRATMGATGHGSFGVPTSSLGAGSYAIGPLDVVQITVYGVPELSGTTTVGHDGNLQLPLLGPTRAAGKTAVQLQQELAARLGADYLQNPQVYVAVTEFNSRYVIVTGAIKNGVIPLKGETTLLELVAAAGGFAEASDSTVLIIREQNGKRTAAKFDVTDIEKGRAQDVVLRSGDRIVAGESVMKKSYGFALKALGLAGRFALF